MLGYRTKSSFFCLAPLEPYGSDVEYIIVILADFFIQS